MNQSAEKYYINVGRASDLKDKKERAIYRALEILPGGLVWITLIGMFFFSWLFPTLAAFFIIAFCVYWLVRTIHFSAHLVSAYRKMKKNLEIDWQKKLDELLPGEWQKTIWHLVVFPAYKEDLRVMRSSFEALAKAGYPKDKIIAVLAI